MPTTLQSGRAGLRVLRRWTREMARHAGAPQTRWTAWVSSPHLGRCCFWGDRKTGWTDQAPWAQGALPGKIRAGEPDRGDASHTPAGGAFSFPSMVCGMGTRGTGRARISHGGCTSPLKEHAQPISICVVLGKELCFSEPHFPHLRNGDKSSRRVVEGQTQKRL